MNAEWIHSIKQLHQLDELQKTFHKTQSKFRSEIAQLKQAIIAYFKKCKCTCMQFDDTRFIYMKHRQIMHNITQTYIEKAIYELNLQDLQQAQEQIQTKQQKKKRGSKHDSKKKPVIVNLDTQTIQDNNTQTNDIDKNQAHQVLTHAILNKLKSILLSPELSHELVQFTVCDKIPKNISLVQYRLPAEYIKYYDLRNEYSKLMRQYKQACQSFNDLKTPERLTQIQQSTPKNTLLKIHDKNYKLNIKTRYRASCIRINHLKTSMEKQPLPIQANNIEQCLTLESKQQLIIYLSNMFHTLQEQKTTTQPFVSFRPISHAE